MLSRTVFASQGNILYPNQKLWLISSQPTATEHIVDKKVIEDEIARRRRVRIVVLTRKEGLVSGPL